MQDLWIFHKFLEVPFLFVFLVNSVASHTRVLL